MPQPPTPKAARGRPLVAVVGNDNTKTQGDWGRRVGGGCLLGGYYWGRTALSGVSPGNVTSQCWSQSPQGWSRGAPRSEMELKGLRHMLLPGVQAGQQGGDAHDVPGLSIGHHRGLVGQQLHACLCQEPWEEETLGWHGVWERRSEGPRVVGCCNGG